MPTIDLADYPDAVATVHTREDPDTLHDLALNWETAECLAMEGYIVHVIAGDPSSVIWSRERIRTMVEDRMAAYADCFLPAPDPFALIGS